MPKERVRHSGNNSLGDILIRWSKQGSAEQADVLGAPGCHVDLFIAYPDLPGCEGSFMFTPTHPENYGVAEGTSIGPISIDLDRRQINRLIRVLRSARDQAYGRDE